MKSLADASNTTLDLVVSLSSLMEGKTPDAHLLVQVAHRVLLLLPRYSTYLINSLLVGLGFGWIFEQILLQVNTSYSLLACNYLSVQLAHLSMATRLHTDHSCMLMSL